jgi:hypothetical protein
LSDVSGTDFASVSVTIEKMIAKDLAFQAGGAFSEKRHSSRHFRETRVEADEKCIQHLSRPNKGLFDTFGCPNELALKFDLQRIGVQAARGSGQSIHFQV